MLVFNKKNFSDRDDLNEDDFIKISLSPDNILVPDLHNNLPGRSVWLPADKSIITDILKKDDLKAYFGGIPALLSSDFTVLIENMLRKKILNSVSLTKKAGSLFIGMDAIKSQLIDRKHCLVITAKGAKSLPRNSLFTYKSVSCFENLFDQIELEKSTGLHKVKYVGIFSKNFKKTIQVDINKLKGFINNH